MAKGLSIKGRVALVTGADRGIGLALVRALIERGAHKVYATARKPDPAAQLATMNPAVVVPLQLDITDPVQVQQAATLAPDVDLLINNAAVLAHALGGFDDPIWL